MRIYQSIIIVLILLCMVPTGQAWLNGWDYRLPIEINNTGAALSNYQYNFTIDTATLTTAGKLQASGADFRVTDDADNLLSFWNENAFNNVSTKIWVKAPSIGITGNITHYIYYGNNSVYGVANGDNTFVFFDDFPGASLNTTKWDNIGGVGVTVSAGVIELNNFGYDSARTILSDTSYGNFADFIFETRARVYGVSGTDEVAVLPRADDPSVSKDAYYFSWFDTSSRSIAKFVGGAYTALSSDASPPVGWANMKGVLAGTSIKMYQDDVLTFSDVDSAHSTGRLGLGGGGSSRTGQFDWIFIRQYTATMPLVSTGVESSNVQPVSVDSEKGTYNNNTGYVDFTWEPAGTGYTYTVDSYNYSFNGGAWTNGTTTALYHFTGAALSWANLTIYGYNSTGDKTSAFTTHDQQIPPNAPITPTLISPADEYTLTGAESNITLECSSTCDWPITYHFYVDGNEVGTNNTGVTFIYDTLGQFGTYDWYVIATHGYPTNNSASVTRQFSVLQVPELLSPGNHSTHNYDYPPQMHDITLSWSDYGAPSYRMILARDVNFTQVVTDSYYTANSTELTLEADKYYWKARTYNVAGTGYSDWSPIADFNITETTPGLGTGVQGIAYDINNAPLSSVLITIWNETYSETYTTGTNGYYVFTEGIKAGNYSIQGSKDEYDNSIVYMIYIFDGATTTRDIYLDNLQGEYDWKWYTRFTVQSIWGVKYADVEVKAYLPGSASACLSGTTGTDGSVTFWVDKDIRYRFTFESDEIINKEIHLYPKEAQYYIIVSYDGSTFDDDSAESNIIGISVAHYPGVNGSVDITYNDEMDGTTALNFTIKERLVNGTHIYIDSYDSFADMSNAAHRFTLTGYSNKEYVVFVNYTHTEYGDRCRGFGISYGNAIAVLDNIFSPFVKGMLAMFILISVGLVFGVANREIGAVLTSFTAVIMHSMGWFNYYNVSPLIIWAGITLALIMSIAAVFGKKSQEQ